MDAQDKQRNRRNHKEKSRRLLSEVSWGEFWKTLDHLVDWNKKRDEIAGLSRSEGED